MEKDKDNKLMVLMDKLSPKEGTLIRELEDDAGDAMKDMFMGNIIPRIKPFIHPMLYKVSEMLGNDKYMVIIRKDANGIPSVIVMENEHISSFETSNEAIKYAKPLKDFIDDALSGNMKDMFE